MLGVVILRMFDPPDLPARHFRLRQLRLHTHPRPHRFQNHRVGLRREPARDLRAPRTVEHAHPRECIRHRRKTVHFQQRLRPVEVILAKFAQRRVRLGQLLVQVQRAQREDDHGVAVVARVIAAFVPILLDRGAHQRLPRFVTEEIVTTLRADRPHLRDLCVGQSRARRCTSSVGANQGRHESKEGEDEGTHGMGKGVGSRPWSPSVQKTT